MSNNVPSNMCKHSGQPVHSRRLTRILIARSLITKDTKLIQADKKTGQAVWMRTLISVFTGLI